MKTALYKNKNFTWWDLENPTEQELVALLKENNINTGNLKDVMDPLHLPKFEENDTYYFSILRLYECDKPEALESIQELTHKLAFYISDSFIVSVHRLPILRLKDVVSKLNNTESTSCYVGLRLMRLAFRSYEQPLLQFDNELEEIENNMMRKNKLRNSILHLYHVKKKTFLSCACSSCILIVLRIGANV